VAAAPSVAAAAPGVAVPSVATAPGVAGPSVAAAPGVAGPSVAGAPVVRPADKVPPADVTAAQAAAPEAGAPRKVEPSATPAPPTSSSSPSSALPRAITPRSSRPSIPGKRLSGDELIVDLFEVMHDLHFLQHPLDGADFVLALIMDKIPSTVGLVHFYDIDAREFVVVRAVGPGAAKALQMRTSEKEPLIAEAMQKRRAVVLRDSAAAERARKGRWALLDVETTSVVCAPVAQGGRFLGVLEIANPRDGRPFSDGDGHALTYIGEQFSEFLGSRGVVLDSERGSNRPAR
jgi:putative methionine-R-sulfoxide reductase with GAF domain